MPSHYIPIYVSFTKQNSREEDACFVLSLSLFNSISGISTRENSGRIGNAF